jgi:hypothetical protein
MIRYLTALLMIILFFSFTPAVHAAGTKKIIPAPVPVNIETSGYSGETWGIGYNFIRLQTTWTDDFYRFEGEEEIGTVTNKVHNIAITWCDNSAGKFAGDFSILAGVIKSTGDERYYSDDMAAAGEEPQNDATFEGSGYDAGVRILRSRRLFKKQSSSFIQWNYSYSIHAAIYYVENNVVSETIPGTLLGEYREEYSEEEWGLFLRPVIALQPKINLSDSVVLVPYLGAGTMLITSSWEWWNEEDYIDDSSVQNGQIAGGSGTSTNTTGLEAYIGFDIAFFIDRASGNSFSLGGVFSRFFGRSETDFFEIHAVYTMPW